MGGWGAPMVPPGFFKFIITVFERKKQRQRDGRQCANLYSENLN
jgi:hypothetical protein